MKQAEDEVGGLINLILSKDFQIKQGLAEKNKTKHKTLYINIYYSKKKIK